MSLLGEESAGEFYLLGLLCYGLLTQEVSSWKCCACEVRWIVFAAPLGFNFSLVGFARRVCPSPAYRCMLSGHSWSILKICSTKKIKTPGASSLMTEAPVALEIEVGHGLVIPQSGQQRLQLQDTRNTKINPQPLLLGALAPTLVMLFSYKSIDLIARFWRSISAKAWQFFSCWPKRKKQTSGIS